MLKFMYLGGYKFKSFLLKNISIYINVDWRLIIKL